MAEDDFDFQPEKRTIENLFVGPEYYIIPRFQRPYSWDRTNLDEFWRDVIHDNPTGYFIGPMVAWRNPKSPQRRIVDGQQRLTTIAILFSVLRDELRDLGEERLANGIHRYLEKYNRDNELEYTLQTEVDAPYLNRGIFKNPPDGALEPRSEEERALHQACRQLRSQVRAEIGKLAQPVPRLTEIRDRLLGLKVIWVEHSDEDDAYTIFETLNSRGKDLEVVDLLKNLLFSRLRTSGNIKADTARDMWNEMRAVIEGEGDSPLDVNRFILHWWLSREEYVAQRKLFRAVKSRTKSDAQAEERLESLCRDVNYYRLALDPGSRKWRIEEEEIGRSLQALEDFRVAQPAPLLLSLLRARCEGDPRLRTRMLSDALKTVERYHFKFTVVSQLSSSGGVSEMYAKAAREIYSAGNSDERARAIKDIRSKLVARQPSREAFISEFKTRFVLTDQITRDSKLVKYVLKSLLRFHHPETTRDNLTVEHILPQDQIGKNGLKAATVGSIGNLLLVSESLNGKLDNRSFTDKRAILASEGVAFDIGGVLDEREWGTKEIEARATMLAEEAYDIVWKLPV